MARLVCKKCQHDNLIDAPVWPSNQPLQDWFCKKCDEKLFSVSFKNPAHADTVPVRCQSCNNSTNIIFNPDDKSSTSASWPCGSCKKVIMQLDIQRERDTKISSPRGVNKSSHTAKQKNEIDSSEKFATFLNKNWKLIGLVAIVALVWISFSDFSPSSYSKNSSPSVSTPKAQNVYRGTKIAKQEFYKYSRSERLRIQKYLKDNFGYRSTIDGLWGPKTASSFIRAANRHVIGKSLYSTGNVTKVFGVALQKQKTAPITSAPVRKSTQKQNNFGLVGQQLNTFNYFKALCLAGVGQNLGICMQNAMCQAQTGRPCQQNIPQKSLHCFINKGAFPMLPDTVICN